MSKLAIIPARGGSKRIPRKNINNFLGKPIIAYSIEAAQKTMLFDEIMVSTEDEEIAGIAERYGAKVPFRRTKKSSDDYATLTDVLTEVLKEYDRRGKHFKDICCILPTAPLTTPSRIQEAHKEYISNKFESLCPVVQFGYPIYRALHFNTDNKLELIWNKYEKVRSQDLSPAYHDSGSFYWVTKEALLKQKTLFCKNGGAIILSEMETQDIDTIEDWKLAELKYRLNNGK